MPSAYPGQAFAELQAKAYPDLRTLVLDRSVEEAFELVEEAVRRLRWRGGGGGAADARRRTPTPGLIEATEQTLLLGFTDDIVIRIEGRRDARRDRCPIGLALRQLRLSARTRRGCAGSLPRSGRGPR